jgi:hypothetical protein
LLLRHLASQRGSCPTCRHAFLDIQPPSESDDESSDGGEYIPNDEDDEDDGFFDTDGFTDDSVGEFEVGEMDVDAFDEMWDEGSYENEYDGTKWDDFSDGDGQSEIICMYPLLPHVQNLIQLLR